jgi:dGTPase
MTSVIPNSFYKPFDYETLAPRNSSDSYRTPFEIDRDRIIYTPAFRRLQAKTQVFMAGEFDFYRTRLTHSIEVAQVGRSICSYLRKTSPLLNDDFFVDPDLVEAVCLSHDLGHPPFGHAGERTLNSVMSNWGGFEGNAQTVRIVSRTIYGDGADRKGMAPTRALLDGVLKYKALRNELDETERENHFLYDDQDDVRAFTSGDSARVSQWRACRSVECQIMDWADDTAYSTNDIVDGCHAGFITIDSLEAWAANASITGDDERSMGTLLETIRARRVDSHFGRLTGEFLRACELQPAGGPLATYSNRHAFALAIDPAVERECRLLKRVAREIVFWSPQLHHLEHKSDFILRRIFEVLSERHLKPQPANQRQIHLLPPGSVAALRDENDVAQRARLLCDYLAGMTDGYAIRTYKRLFDPDFSSINELG